MKICSSFTHPQAIQDVGDFFFIKTVKKFLAETVVLGDS